MIKPAIRNQDGKLLSPSRDTDNLILFTSYEGRDIGCIIEQNSLIRVFTAPEGLPIGTVCLGKVSEIKRAIDSAFLMVAGGQKCYLPLKELTPERNLSRPGQTISCGDNVLVKIKKEPAKKKLATATTVFSDEERSQYGDLHRTDYAVLSKGLDYIGQTLTCAAARKLQYRIITDDAEVYAGFGEASFVFPDELIVSECKFYEDSLVKLNVLYGLGGKVEEGLLRKINLRSGAFITIEPTEAMTVIDVNSGKREKKNASKDEFYSINREAGLEILHQILLRNLSGMILIDFINMHLSSEREELFQFMKERAKTADPALRIVDYTRLGIMECTRAKSGKTLYEQIRE